MDRRNLDFNVLNEKKDDRIDFRVPRSFREEVEELARNEGRTPSNMFLLLMELGRIHFLTNNGNGC